VTVSALTPHDATAAVPPHARRSLPEADQLPPAPTPTLRRRPPLPTRRLMPPPAPAADLSDPAGTGAATGTGTGTGSGPIAACGPCLLVATGAKGDVLAVDPSRPRAPRRVLGRHGARVTGLVVCGGLVFSVGSDGLVIARAVAGPDDLATVVARHPAGLTGARLAPDGRLVTAGHDGRVLAWRSGSAEVLASHAGGVEAVVVLAAGGVVTAGRDGRLLHRHTAGPAAGESPVELRQRRRRRELTLAMTPVGRGGLLTAGGQRGVVRLWGDLGHGGWPEELGVHGGWVFALVALDADRVAAVGGEHVTVWDLRTGDGERIALGGGLHATAAVGLVTGDLAVADVRGAVEVLPASVLAT
jgi:hypothetical protein